VSRRILSTPPKPYLPMGHRTVHHTFKTALALTCAAAICLGASATALGRSRPAADGSYGIYVLGRLAQACGFGADVRLFRGPVAYAQAVVIDDREAIFYNPRSLDALESESGTPWAAVSVIAHELGHHYYGHAAMGVRGVPADEILQCELDADYFSGYALARVGASLADAQAAQRSLDAVETELHPCSPQRLRAIEAGWRDGRRGRPISPLPICRMDVYASVPGAKVAPSAVDGAALSVESGRW
jgi:hypothetical protein